MHQPANHTKTSLTEGIVAPNAARGKRSNSPNRSRCARAPIARKTATTPPARSRRRETRIASESHRRARACLPSSALAGPSIATPRRGPPVTGADRSPHAQDRHAQGNEHHGLKHARQGNESRYVHAESKTGKREPLGHQQYGHPQPKHGFPHPTPRKGKTRNGREADRPRPRKRIEAVIKDFKPGRTGRRIRRGVDQLLIAILDRKLLRSGSTRSPSARYGLGNRVMASANRFGRSAVPRSR